MLARILGVLGAVLLLGYAGLVAYLSINERAFIYQPGDRQVAAPPPDLALDEQRVTYPSTDGVVLSAWIVPARRDPVPPMWLLICHGNFGNVGYGQRPEFYAFMRDIGLNLLAFDYRGFGESTGRAEEAGLYADALASYQYLRSSRHLAAEQIVIFGHSLGTGVAVELASRVPAAALILDAAYTSVVDRARERYPLLPIGLISTQRFPSRDRIARAAMPKLFLHSPEDAVIPYADGRRLFDAAGPPKRFVDVKGGHENAYRVDRAVYFGAIAALLGTLGPPGPSGSSPPAGPADPAGPRPATSVTPAADPGVN